MSTRSYFEDNSWDQVTEGSSANTNTTATRVAAPGRRHRMLGFRVAYDGLFTGFNQVVVKRGAITIMSFERDFSVVADWDYVFPHVFIGNENDRSQARQFVGLLRQLALAIEGSVLITAHPSVRGIDSGTGTSGVTAWNNTVRSRLYLTRPAGNDSDENDERRLKKMKANYSRIGDEIRMSWRDGVFVARDEPTGVRKGIANRSAERVFLELLTKRNAQDRAVSHSKHASNYAPKELAAMEGREGFGSDDMRRAMERLFEDGRIAIDTYGRKGDPRQRIVAAKLALNKPDELPLERA